MAKIVLQNVASGYNLQTINDNFSKIQTELQNKVLYRDNPVTEPNSVNNNLDINGNSIYNVKKIETTQLLVNGVDISVPVSAIGGLYQKDFFIGDGVATTFSLSRPPTVSNNSLVVVEGIVQSPDTYTLNGASLTFGTAPPAPTVPGTRNIVVSFVGTLAVGIAGPTGPTGPAGPANTLAIGSVTSGAAAATITGTSPNQTLNFVLQTGATGNTGPANSLGIGTVTNGGVGVASATITGTAPSQTLNLVLPQGIQGPQGNPGTGTGTVTHTAGALTANALMVGNAVDDSKVLGSLGTTSTVLHGNAAGLPTFGAVILTTDVSGILPTANGGTGSSTLSFPSGTVNIGYLEIPQNSQSTAYTLVLTDSGKHILHPAADTTARTYTIPANSSVAYPVGASLTFINQNAAGVITIAINTDTMRLAGAGTTGSRTLAANGMATAIKITSTEWIINGTGLT
jgi:hypothetical protein